MNELNIKGKQRKNDKYHSYRGEVGKVAANLQKEILQPQNHLKN